jgi:hypothetical protein
MTIQAGYLGSLATQISTDITKAVINNSITVSTLTESVTSNVYQVTFVVTHAQTSLVTNIKLEKSDGTVVSDNDVSIPIPSDQITIRQTITVSEVIS